VLAHDDFPTLGKALWWSLQTVTTVGYGDVTPTSTTGRVIAGVLMVSGIAFLSVLTASISAAFVGRMQTRRTAAHEDPAMAALERIEQRLDEIDRRLGER
jgi:voltage-gated potassium channel Kch